MAAASYGALFRNRPYVRIFSAGLGSTLGSAISSVCLIWVVFAATGSALDVAFLGTAFLLASMLCSTLSGTIVDRYDRRRLMILADSVRAVAMASVVVALWVVGFDLYLLLAAYAVVGAFTTLFNPAEQAIVPAVVAATDLENANGLIQSSRSSLQFVGASVAGGLIVTVGPTVGIAVNAVTFAISAALITGMRIAESARIPRRGGRRASYREDLRAGFAWLYRATGLFQLTISATFFNFCSTVIATFLVVYATEVLHGSALVFAFLLAAQVAGLAIGSVLVGRVGAVRFVGKAWVLPYGVASGAVALLLSLVPSATLATAVMFVLGLFAGFAGTAWLSAAQLLVPSEMQGRYFGIDQLGSIAILPAAQIGGALLIAGFGTRTTYLAAAVVWLVAGAAFLVPRALWTLAVHPAPPATPRNGGGEAGRP